MRSTSAACNTLPKRARTRKPGRARRARAKSHVSARARARSGGRLRRRLRRGGSAAALALKKLCRSTRKDNIQFDGLARVSHVTDATDWRVEYPFVVIHPDREDETAALVRDCIELGLTSSRAAAARLHRRRSAAHAPVGGHQYRKTRYPGRSRGKLAAGRGAPGRDHTLRRGRGDQARDGGGGGGRPCVRVDPTSADASCIGGNVAMNAAARKRCCGAPRWTTSPPGAWSTQTAFSWKSRASGTTSARSTMPLSPASRYSATAATAAPPGASPRCWKSRRAFSQAGLGKDVTTSSCRAAASRRKAATASSLRALHPAQDAGASAPCAGILRPGARLGAGHRRDQALPRLPRARACGRRLPRDARRAGAHGRALSQGRGFMRPRPSTRRGRRPAENGADRRHRREDDDAVGRGRFAGGAHRHARGGEDSSPSRRRRGA